MPRKIKVSELPEFDMSRFLEDEEDIAAHLNDVIAEDDPSLFSAALGDIARARGMTEIARVSGISREALYRALSSSSQPRFETISRVCAALASSWSPFPHISDHWHGILHPPARSQ